MVRSAQLCGERARVNASLVPKPDFRGFRDSPSKGLGFQPSRKFPT